MAKDGIPADKISITLTRRQWVMLLVELLPTWRKVYRDGYFDSMQTYRAAKSIERQLPPTREQGKGKTE